MTQADLFDNMQRTARARLLRDQGMQTAIDHADAVSEEWSERAYGKLRAYVAGLHSGALFTCEVVRDYAERSGLPPPPDKRAWGGIMVRGRHAGLFRKHGFTIATDPKVHCNPVSQWVRS